MTVNGADRIHDQPIENELRESFLSYSMSVIVSRALPDVRDGLKPVHRRILYAMHDVGLQPNRPYRKSATVVGEVLGKYHPHGDSSVYEAMVRMAQDFSLRAPLVDGQGNFGSVDGDPAAAMRYTEARMTPMATEMLQDVHADTVDFVPNFDESQQEPSVLPARFPNLLVNGSEGIAVGMATKIPPHNALEVIDAAIAVTRNPKISAERIARHIKGPDFPTGGIVGGGDGIQAAIRSGRGSFKIRPRVHVESLKGGRAQLVFTEIPYQVNKSAVLQRIAGLVRERKIEGISDLRDESDRDGMRMIVELKRDASASPARVLGDLLRLTPLEQTYGVNLVALVDGVPRTLSYAEVLRLYVEHRVEVVRRRAAYNLKRARDRMHIVEGLLKALDALDDVVKIIRRSPNSSEARAALIKRLKISERQAQAILDLRLARLTALEIDKLKEEHAELLRTVENLEALLASEDLVRDEIVRELREVKSEYAKASGNGGARRTEIQEAADSTATVAPGGSAGEAAPALPEVSEAAQDVVVRLGRSGAVSAVPMSLAGSRPERGEPIAVLRATTAQDIVFLTDKGNAWRMPVRDVPGALRAAGGSKRAPAPKKASGMLGMGRGERVIGVTAVDTGANTASDASLLLVTTAGQAKRVALSDVAGGGNGSVLRLDKKDAVAFATTTYDADDALIVTAAGKVLRFPASELRPAGRPAGAVKGISMARGDRPVAALAIPQGVDETTDLVLAPQGGQARRVSLTEYRTQGRGGMGVAASKLDAATGGLAGAVLADESTTVAVSASSGEVVRVQAGSLLRLERASRNKVPRLNGLPSALLTDHVSAEYSADALRTPPPNSSSKSASKKSPSKNGAKPASKAASKAVPGTTSRTAQAKAAVREAPKRAAEKAGAASGASSAPSSNGTTGRGRKAATSAPAEARAGSGKQASTGRGAQASLTGDAGNQLSADTEAKGTTPRSGTKAAKRSPKRGSKNAAPSDDAGTLF